VWGGGYSVMIDGWEQVGSSPRVWRPFLKRSFDAGRSWEPAEAIRSPCMGPAKNKVPCIHCLPYTQSRVPALIADLRSHGYPTAAARSLWCSPTA
jgi:hypothetical protein